MREWLLDVLACPTCKAHPLICEVTMRDNTEIIEGKLRCIKCNAAFNIQDGIPRMLGNDFNIDEMESSNLQKHTQVRDANITYHDDCASFYERDISTALLYSNFNQSRMENIIRDLSKKGENRYFLDIGCGTGTCLGWGKSYYEHAVGVDVSIKMLKIAKARGLEVIQSDALFLPFSSNAFNTISAVAFLHHVYDTLPVLEEISRVLKEDGSIYLDWEPNRAFWKKVTQWVPRRFRSSIKESLYRMIFFLPLAPDESRPDYKYTTDINPSATETQKLAEYSHFSDEPGIEPVIINNHLNKLGFSDIVITNHWMGRQISQLPILYRWLALIFISYYKNTSPHFSILAKKS